MAKSMTLKEVLEWIERTKRPMIRLCETCEEEEKEGKEESAGYVYGDEAQVETPQCSSRVTEVHGVRFQKCGGGRRIIRRKKGND